MHTYVTPFILKAHRWMRHFYVLEDTGGMKNLIRATPNVSDALFFFFLFQSHSFFLSCLLFSIFSSFVIDPNLGVLKLHD